MPLPWEQQINDLTDRVDRLERAQREDHEVLMGLVGRVERFAEFAGVEFSALRQGQRDTLEAVDGLHSGALALAKANGDLVKAAQESVPPWLAKIAVGVLGAVLTAVLVDLAIHASHALLGW